MCLELPPSPFLVLLPFEFKFCYFIFIIFWNNVLVHSLCILIAKKKKSNNNVDWEVPFIFML